MPIINTIGNASGRAYGFTSGGPSVILLSATPGPSATISTYSGYIVFKFTSTGTLNVGAGAPGTADVFVVAGGNDGSPGSTTVNGGDGGTRADSPSVTITSNTPIPVVVGGAATNSTFGPITSSGGTAGGTGGTAGISSTPGGNGGNGPSNSYETGSPQAYGGGGGGGGGTAFPVSGSGGAGGSSGGGPGGQGARNYPNPSGFDDFAATPGSNGLANTGGGGGGAGVGTTNFPPSTYASGGTGGSGVVIVRFPNTQFRTS